MSNTVRIKHFLFSCSVVLVLYGLSDNITRAQEEQTPVRVGRLVYAGGMTSRCFADGFLDTVERETGIKVQRTLEPVNLASEQIFEFPLLIMTGEDGFTLSDTEKQNLKAYLNRGGFLLASAGCSNQDWAASYRRVMAEVLPDQSMQPISLDHPMFHTIYDIERIEVKKGSGGGAIYGLEMGGRLAAVFSPLGLNDTGNAGGGCCCCGGNELKNAKQINANILVYSLIH